ncbi:hypothetical protein ACJMK2_018635, partial [Sinanodonta woodiana]
IDLLMNQYLDVFPTYKGCEIKSFLENPDRVQFNLKFDGDQSPSVLEEALNKIIYQDLPKVRYDRWLGYQLGDLLIYYDNYTEITEVPMKFRVLNLTWTDDLLDRNSASFQYHASLFCKDVSSLFSIIRLL